MAVVVEIGSRMAYVLVVHLCETSSSWGSDTNCERNRVEIVRVEI